jgi:hypothetical protein
LVEEVGVEILKYEITEGSNLNETWVINSLKAMSPDGSLCMTLSQKNGEYVGKQITFRRDWDYEKCADEVIAGRGEIVFKWRNKFDGAVEISTTFFGRYCTGSTASVMFPGRAKRNEIMRDTVDDEMVRPILFEVRTGGTEDVVGYTETREGNDWLKESMERRVWVGMDREGIVVNKSKTKWGFSNVFCESCCEKECVWDVAQAEMVQYMLTQPEDCTNSVRRRLLYRQMAIRLNEGQPLGKGNRVELPPCVISGVRSLFPAEDGSYMGHRYE